MIRVRLVVVERDVEVLGVHQVRDDRVDRRIELRQIANGSRRLSDLEEARLDPTLLDPLGFGRPKIGDLRPELGQLLGSLARLRAELGGVRSGLGSLRSALVGAVRSERGSAGRSRLRRAPAAPASSTPWASPSDPLGAPFGRPAFTAATVDSRPDVPWSRPSDLPAALHQPEHTRAVDGRSTVRAIHPISAGNGGRRS